MSNETRQRVTDMPEFEEIKTKAMRTCAVIRQICGERFLPSKVVEAAQANAIGRIATNELERQQ
ncbi:MAG: hypothetical protein ACOY45_04525 [Pseudomonadota bacterium]